MIFFLAIRITSHAQNKAKRSHSKELENNFNVEQCAETKTKRIGHIN